MRRMIAMVAVTLLLGGLTRTPTPPPVPVPLPGSADAAGFYDYRGLIHFHTEYSGDATGTYAEIARDASAAGMRFMIATEHDNLRAVADGREGWYGGVLMLSGVESRRPEGYVLGLGITRYDALRETPTQTVLASMKDQNGLIVLAHPRNPRWAWKGPVDDRIGAIEILDLADTFEAATPTETATALVLLPVNRTKAYLELGRHNQSSLDAWDEVTVRRRFGGLYAPDFHQSIKLSDEDRLRFPPASDIIPLASNHVLTRTPLTGDVDRDRHTLYEAIREGSLYVSVDVLGDTTGFRFRGRQGRAMIEMGQETLASDPVILTIDSPPTAQRRGADIHVLRNGVEIARFGATPKQRRFVTSGPGVYRVEVRVPVEAAILGRSRTMTWIYSNPIYIRG